MKIICIGRNYADHVRELRDGGTNDLRVEHIRLKLH